jgi:hypothetical protein
VAPVRRRNLVICAVTFVFAAAACSLDFTARPATDDAGSPPDAAAPDATSDAPSVDAADAGTTDADAAVDCEALIAEVGTKKTAARMCSLGAGNCQTTTKDQCDCDVVIADPGSDAVTKYQQAVDRLKMSACAKGCTTCIAVTNKNCLSTTEGTLCYQN